MHDGTKPVEELSKDQKENALSELPTILEMFSHAFFIGGYVLLKVAINMVLLISLLKTIILFLGILLDLNFL